MHLLCVHGDQDRLEKQSRKLDVGTSMQSTVSVDEIIKSDVRSIMDSVLCKVDGLCAKSMGAKQRAGKTRHAYSAQFKADVIHAYDEPGNTQPSIADKYGVTESSSPLVDKTS